jgi:hypothetical protein
VSRTRSTAYRPGRSAQRGRLGARGLAREVPGLDRERAALRHRVAPVHREVDQHLLELRRVGQHARCGFREVEHDLDVGAEQAAQQPREVVHRLVPAGARRRAAGA